MIKYFFSILFILGFGISHGQELNCSVNLNYASIKTTQQTNPQIYKDIEMAIKNFMNNQRWTTDNFSQKEKINCSLTINLIKSPSQFEFEGNAQFKVLRPIYGTNYESVIFQYVDKSFNFSFSPEESQMVFTEQNFTNNLTSTLAFYAMIALTFDYDSFSKLGGNKYLEKAFNIVNFASQKSDIWSANGDPLNKYWLLENYRNQQFIRFREGIYEYHRLAMDDFKTDPVQARKLIFDFLQNIKNISLMKFNSVLLNSFLDAKATELVNVFSESKEEERKQVYDILTSLDPAKTETYRLLLK